MLDFFSPMLPFIYFLINDYFYCIYLILLNVFLLPRGGSGKNATDIYLGIYCYT